MDIVNSISYWVAHNQLEAKDIGVCHRTLRGVEVRGQKG